MQSQPQNPEFRINPVNFKRCIQLLRTSKITLLWFSMKILIYMLKFFFRNDKLNSNMKSY